MSEITLKYYKTTLSYSHASHQKKLRNVRKQIRTRMSRRRLRKAISNTLHHFHLS